ncbi:hypothetical protein IJG04_03195 [Candidatus Saccharibacteria bacterium]|nr:hypothetical protein [Candidatus Saccharibacteria bacterium]
MNWLALVAVATLANSTVIFIDNYVSDFYFKGRHAVSQKLFYGLAGIILATAFLLIFGIDFTTTSPLNILIFMGAGALVSFAGIPYCRALELDDSTNLGIFLQLAPVLYLVFGWFVLDQSFSPTQLIAFVIIFSAPLLIIFSTRKRSRKIKLRAMFLAFLYVLIYVTGNIIFVKENSVAGNLNFFSEIGLFILGRSIFDVFIVSSRRTWRKRFFHVVKSSKGKVLRPLFVDFLIYAVATTTYRSALVSAPSVAIASAASDSAEPIAIFFLGLLFTLISPKFGREKMDKKTVLVHLVATILVVAGITVIQITA